MTANPPSQPTRHARLRPLETALIRSWPPPRWRDLTVVVGVSGGADSVALIRALHALRRWPSANEGSTGQLIIAHYNHGLRGESSDGDARFVRELASQLGLACEVGGWQASGEAPPAENGSRTINTSPPQPSDENRLRQRRLEFLLETAHRHGARYVALAHTANDQSETVLHRLIRGTGLTGLAGIPRVRRLSPATTLIRPMLAISRHQIVRYLKSLAQPFRHDHSNDDPRYTRNRLRHGLLPHLAAHYNPRILRVLARLSAQARAVESLVEPLAEALFDRVVRSSSPVETLIDTVPLRDQPEYLIAELFVRIWDVNRWPAQAMTAQHWRRLARRARLAGPLAEQPRNGTGAQSMRRSTLDLPGSVRVERLPNGQLRLTRGGSSSGIELEKPLLEAAPPDKTERPQARW
jgi:tRNA(Ile)-lysidine synthase